MPRKHRLGRVAIALAAAGSLIFTAAACSSSSKVAAGNSSSGGSQSGKLPSVINIYSLRDMTGIYAFSGVPAVNGAQLAFSEINSTHFLGNTQLSMTIGDAAGNAQTAASRATAAVASHKYAAILGPLFGSESLVTAPIAEKASVPVIFTESNVDGVLLGKYTFRATAPTVSYYGIMGEYLKAKGIKTINIIYDSTIIAEVDVFKYVQSTFGSQYGIKVVGSTGVQGDTKDFSAPASRVVSSKAESVGLYISGPANATAVQQLRQAGFTGPIIASNGAGAGNLKGAGSAGAGVAWPTDFSASETNTSAQAFISAYRAKYKADPNNYAAEGYDAAWFLARGIKAAQSADPSAVASGLATVAEQGFQGAMGHITFDGNDMRTQPVIVQWTGTAETVIPTPASS
jgi:branched-chain amino acid transport system substrate-binding protein